MRTGQRAAREHGHERVATRVPGRRRLPDRDASTWTAPRPSRRSRARSSSSGVDPGRLDSWIGIDADGMVTAYTGKCELGQGMATAQVQLVAEELSVAPARVRLVQCDTVADAGPGHDFGQPVVADQLQPSQPGARRGHRARGAGAARLVATRAAGRPVDGRRWHGPRACRCRASCWLRRAGGRAGDSSCPSTRPRSASPPATGRCSAPPSRGSICRRWRPAAFEFVHNVRVKGMVHGAVVRPPGPGATLERVDEGSVRGMPGFITLVVRKNFVGVVCEKPWQAVQAARALKASWKTGPALPRRRTSTPSCGASRPATRWSSIRGTSIASSRAPRPWCGPPTGTRTRCTGRWAPRARWPMSARTLRQSGPRRSRPIRRGIRRPCSSACPRSSVRVVFVRGSGCYGLNGADTVSYDAALLSQAAGRPVRVQLSRQDEMAWENYGYAYAIDLRVGLDASGTIVAWDCESWYRGARRTPRLRHAGQRGHRHARRLRAGAVLAWRGRRHRRPRSTTAATPRRPT